MLQVPLSPRAIKSLGQGHPWVFQSDIVMNSALELSEPGSLVQLVDKRANVLAIGYLHPQQTIAVRILSHTAKETIDTAFFLRLMSTALSKREQWFLVPYYRLVHSEGDGLPGLIVDRFGDVVVCQTSTAGMERLKPLWIPALTQLLSPKSIVFRDDTPARVREGLAQQVQVEGEPITAPVRLLEHDTTYLADALEGQKTGWFYDQRAHRAHIASLASGKSVLDVYSHSGGFGLAAANAGAASVTLVDSSARALGLARDAAALNPRQPTEYIEADAMEFLQASDTHYDIVLVDPPAFVKEKKHLHAGLKGYEKLARLAMPRVKEGGIFFIASCSHHATPSLFRKAVETGIKSSGRRFTLIAQGGADKDHPIHYQLKENTYLKALTYRMDA